MREDQRRALIGAYLRERAGLARRGLADRVAQVDEELVRLGYVPEPREATPPKRRTTAQRRG